MASLSSALIGRCRDTLLKSDKFDTALKLQTVFAVQELEMYRRELPEADNPVDRVDKTISFLLQKGIQKGQLVFLLFLRTLLIYVPRDDDLYAELIQRCFEVEGEFNLSKAVDASEERGLYIENKTSGEQDKQGEPFPCSARATISSEEEAASRTHTRQSNNIAALANRNHEDILIAQKAVKDTRKVFNPRKNVIYEDECNCLIDPLSRLSRKVQELDKLATRYPLVFGQIRSPLIMTLHLVESQLSDLQSLVIAFCPNSMEAPVKQRQDIQNKIEGITRSLRKINNLMKTFKRLISSLESERPVGAN